MAKILYFNEECRDFHERQEGVKFATTIAAVATMNITGKNRVHPHTEFFEKTLSRDFCHKIVTAKTYEETLEIFKKHALEGADALKETAKDQIFDGLSFFMSVDNIRQCMKRVSLDIEHGDLEVYLNSLAPDDDLEVNE